MKARVLSLFAGATILAACQSGQGNAPAPAATAPAPAAVAASGPEETCIAKVAAASGQAASIVTVASVEQTLGGQLIMLNVVGSTNPWRCTVDDRGVAEVEPAVKAPS